MPLDSSTSEGIFLCSVLTEDEQSVFPDGLELDETLSDSSEEEAFDSDPLDDDEAPEEEDDLEEEDQLAASSPVKKEPAPAVPFSLALPSSSSRRKPVVAPVADAEVDMDISSPSPPPTVALVRRSTRQSTRASAPVDKGKGKAKRPLEDSVEIVSLKRAKTSSGVSVCFSRSSSIFSFLLIVYYTAF